MAVLSNIRLSMLPFFVCVLYAGCSGRPISPEEQLRNLLNEAEMHLEARDLSSAMAFVDPAYEDNTGRDFRALKAMLLGYFLRHKSIHILSKIDQIRLHSEKEADLIVFAALVGSPQEEEMELSQWRGDLLRLQFRFIQNEEGDWLLHMAQWRRAAPGDFSR